MNSPAPQRGRSATAKASLLAVIAAIAMFASQMALAMLPQTGIYWNPLHPGRAMYVEHQNGTIFAVLYGYSNTDSSPEFYVASGPVLPDMGADFFESVGMYPIQGFGSPLYRVPSGSCLACPYTPIPAAERVGTLWMMFPSRGGLFTYVAFSDGRLFPTPEDYYGEPMQRFNFALGGTPTQPSDPDSSLFTDVRGEWVFTDQSDPTRPAWRFKFSTREDGADLSDFPLQSSVAFRDTERNSVLYCYVPNIVGLEDAVRESLPTLGCELRQNGVALFWTLNEISIDEFYGTLGPAPPRSAHILRGPQRVIGRRISD